MHVGGEDVRFRIPLLKSLQQYGFNISVAGSESSIVFKAQGIEYYPYYLKRGLQPLADMKSIFELVQIFRKHKINIVHAFDTKPGLLVPIAATFAGVPIVVKTIAGMGYVFSSEDLLALTLKPVYRLLQKMISCMTDITVFQNKDDSRYFLAHRLVQKDRQMTILSSGIDLTVFDSQKVEPQKLSVLRDELGINQKIVIILVSRLVRNKGIIEYMEAARLVKRKHHNTRFLLVGPHKTEGKQAIPLHLLDQYNNDVVYLGQRNDVRELLAISNMFVLPSYYREGVPRVLLEAGAMGLPIITTNMPGCREVVQDGWNGLLVPIRDAKALAESMERLISNKELCKVMGERSRIYIKENFSLKMVAEAHANLYKELLEKKGNKHIARV